MNWEELEAAYQREARLANSVSLSVPVALQVQQLEELRKITAILEALLGRFPSPSPSITPTSKKDSRP